MLNKRVFIILVFFTLLGLQKPLLCSNRSSKSNIENYSTNNKLKKLSYENSASLNENFNILPSTFKYFLNELIANFDNKELENNNYNFNIDIESDFQKESDSTFIAEGNVIVRTNNAVLRADSVKYDRNSKKIYIDGNIKFKTDSQFFIAEKIEYEFINKKGFISDVYGSIDFDGLADINLQSENDIKIDNDFLKISQLRELTLNNSSIFSVNNIFNQNKIDKSDNSFIKNLEEKSIETKFKEIKNTRFSSKKININDDVWQSDIMLLTTDPFNYPQLIIFNNDFKIYFDDGISEIKSKWSSLNLDKKFSIPLGPTRIKLDEDKYSKWGVGYDNKNYDGLYIFRNSETLDFGTNNLELKLKPKFFLQRSLLGKTKSFPKKDTSTFSPKVEQEANLADYFGLSGSFVSDLNDWIYVLEFDINSLNFERFNNALESQTYLTKNLFFDNKNGLESRDLTFFGSYRDKTKNGSLGEIVINNSYGTRYDIIKNRGNKSSQFSLIYGNYRAKSQIKETLINKNRLNVFFKNNISYSLWEPKVSAFIDKTYLYSPNVIRKGIFLDVETIFDFYRYNDNDFKQDMFSVKVGPRIIYGDFKKKFFDYTELSIYPRFKFNRGRSPFTFDQIVDNRVIELVANQQIYGPLTLKLSSEINIEEDFENDRLINPIVDLGINRRAYNFGLYYNFDSEAAGFTFKIHSFKFNGLGEKF